MLLKWSENFASHGRIARAAWVPLLGILMLGWAWLAIRIVNGVLGRIRTWLDMPSYVALDVLLSVALVLAPLALWMAIKTAHKELKHYDII